MSTENPYQSPASYEPTVLERSEATPVKPGLLSLLFSFRGRIPRSSYWVVVLLSPLLVPVIMFALSAISPLAVSQIYYQFFYVVAALMAWIQLAARVKRWHDRDMSGWWCLISLVPAIGSFYAFAELGCLRGTLGPNRFGEDPTADFRSGANLAQLKQGLLLLDRVIELDGTDTSDEDLAKVVLNEQIEELRLGETAITDAGLMYLRHLPRLQRLDLSLTQISDAGLASLAELNHLTTLWLGGTQITDDGLLQLANLMSLENVYVTNTKVTPMGVRRLGELLPGCQVHH